MEHQRPQGLSRRRALQLGTATIGAAVLGTTLASPARADGTGAGEDGASASDTRFMQKFDAAEATAANAASETSYNGWPVGTPGSSIGIATYYALGTSVAIPVKSGDVSTVLMYVAGRFNAGTAVYIAERTSLRMEYEGMVSGSETSHGGHLRISYLF